MSDALYIRIAKKLRKKILSGKLMPDDLLPSENELALTYKTSRVTVRKALDILEHEGLVKARQGKGYYVQPPQHSVFTLVFGDNDIGGVYRSQEVGVEPPDGEVAAALKLSDGEKAVVYRHVLLRRGKAIAYDEKYIPHDRDVPGVENDAGFADFYELLRDRYAAMSLRTELSILSCAPSAPAAEALCVSADVPLLAVNRLVLTADGPPVAYGRQYLTPDCGPIVARSGQFLFQRK